MCTVCMYVPVLTYSNPCKPARVGEHGVTPTLCMPSACTVKHCPLSLFTTVWFCVNVQSCSRASQQLVGSSHIADAALLVHVSHEPACTLHVLLTLLSPLWPESNRRHSFP